MEKVCDCCLNKFNPNVMRNVRILMIDRNPGCIHFNQVLKICFGFAVRKKKQIQKF